MYRKPAARALRRPAPQKVGGRNEIAARSDTLKVLFLSQRVPWPPDRGDRITTSHILGHLLSRGATIRVATLAEAAADEEAAATLSKRVEAVCAPRISRQVRKFTSLRGLATGEALTLPFFRSRELTATVNRWVAEDPPDLIYVYTSSMAQYVMEDCGAVRVMQFAELDSDKWRQYAEHGGLAARWIYGREARRLLDFEKRVARTFDVSMVVSEVEKELFMQHIPDIDPFIVPNGVDTEHFQSAGDENRHPHTVVFTGVMDYEPNVDGVLWFADNCWPSIRQRVPDARFLVVGSKPIKPILDLGKRPGIEVTGRVPETPPYFDSAAVAIAPLRLARGIQNKVLEAMSMSLPIVLSSQAAQGLGGAPANTIHVANEADEVTDAVCRLLEDPAGAREMGERAGAFVREHFHWNKMFALFDAAIDDRLAAKGVRTSGVGAG